MRETQVRSLGGEGPLEEEMATHSSVLAWEIPRTEEAGGLQPAGSQRVGHNGATEDTSLHTAQKREKWFLAAGRCLRWHWDQTLQDRRKEGVDVDESAPAEARVQDAKGLSGGEGEFNLPGE